MGHDDLFAGIFPAVPTVCDSKGELDEEGQRSVVRFCIEKGAHGIACLLLAGEFYKFGDEERKKVAQVVVSESRGSLPVLVGISHSGTTPALMLGRHAKDIGASGVIVTPPYHANFVHEASKSLVKHYSRVAAGVDLPVMIQDFSSPGGVELRPRDVLAITREFSNVRYIKVEGTDHLARIGAVKKATRGSVRIFGGMAGRYLLEELALGTSGSIPGAEIVERIVEVYELAVAGRQTDARRAYDGISRYLDFFVANFGSFVEVEKEVLKFRGVIRDSTVRDPSIPLTARRKAELLRILRAMKVEPEGR